MLGHRLLLTLRALGYEAEGAGRSNLSAAEDGSDEIEAVLRWRAPDVVVNCIGWVRQRAFEAGPAEAICVNAVFPHRLSSACKRLGIDLVHISTDCVGDRDWYGASKMLGESIEHGVVLRTSFIGHELHRKLGLLEWALSQQGRNVPGYVNALWNGLTTNELADVIGRLVLPNVDLLRGLAWDVCGPEITKCALLELINDVYHCGLSIVPMEGPAIDHRLNGRAFARSLRYEPPSWRVMLGTMQAFSQMVVPSVLEEERVS
jgi:dTDP-4-dehydrorhamnose reductase